VRTGASGKVILRPRRAARRHQQPAHGTMRSAMAPP